MFEKTAFFINSLNNTDLIFFLNKVVNTQFFLNLKMVICKIVFLEITHYWSKEAFYNTCFQFQCGSNCICLCHGHIWNLMILVKRCDDVHHNCQQFVAKLRNSQMISADQLFKLPCASFLSFFVLRPSDVKPLFSAAFTVPIRTETAWWVMAFSP
jgi:hypothetical protein